MKKQTLTFAAFAVATLGWISVASAQGPGAQGPGAQGPGEGHMRRPGGPGGPGFGPGGPEGHEGPPIEMVARHLVLTDEQKEQWKAIHTGAREAGEPLMKAAGVAKQAFDKAMNAETADANALGQAALAMRDAHKKVEAHQKATFESVKAILTPEQLAKVEGMEKQGARRGPGFGAGGPGGPGGAGGQEGRPRKRHRPEGSN